MLFECRPSRLRYGSFPNFYLLNQNWIPDFISISVYSMLLLVCSVSNMFNYYFLVHQCSNSWKGSLFQHFTLQVNHGSAFGCSVSYYHDFCFSNKTTCFAKNLNILEANVLEVKLLHKDKHNMIFFLKLIPESIHPLVSVLNFSPVDHLCIV